MAERKRRVIQMDGPEGDEIRLRELEADLLRDARNLPPDPAGDAAFEDVMEATRVQDELDREKRAMRNLVSDDPTPDDPTSLDHYVAGTGAFAPDADEPDDENTAEGES